MTGKADFIAEEAEQLERQERVAIIERLLESLEPASPDDASQLQAARRSEVQQRSKQLKDGDVKSIP